MHVAEYPLAIVHGHPFELVRAVTLDGLRFHE
jgi:hypothetical protein